MNKPITVFVDSGKAVARLSGPLVLGDTYAVTFSGLSTEEAAASPEMIVLGPKPGEIAARSGEDSVLAMTTKPCLEAFAVPPVPPVPRPREFPHPPLPPNPPVHWRGGPHGAARMHFYVVAGGQTLAQGDAVLLWAPFEYDEAGEPIQLKGEKGEKGDKGKQGDKGDPGRNGVYVAMDGLYAFHVSQGDHPEDGHLWIHAQEESTLYAKDQNGNYLTDGDGNRIPLYYIGPDGHLRYRFFYADSTHVELDLGRIVTREGLYAFHVSDGSDGEPDGHLMLHGQDLSQLYATDADGELILDGQGNPIPLFRLDENGHLIYTFYGEDGQVHATLDIGDVRGTALTWDDLTEEQKASLKGETGSQGPQGPQGDPLTWSDLTPEQKAALKGDKGDPGQDGLTEEDIREIVTTTMGDADDRPVNGSSNWVTSGGLWSVEQAILSMIRSLAAKIAGFSGNVSGAYHYKGTVDTVDELPATGNEPGDVWNVRRDETHEDGMNYAWTGEEWDALGATVDLSAYLRTADLDTALHALAGTSSWFYSDVSSVAANALSFAGQAYDLAGSAMSAATDAQNTADSKPSSSDVASAIDTAIAAIPDPDVMGASLPSGVSGDNLGDWISNASNFLGQLPSSTDMLAQRSDGNVYAGSSPSNVLTTPPRINGDELALARAIAEEYDAQSTTYEIGDYCTYEGKLYKATAQTSGSWDSSDWDEVTATDELNAVKATIPAAQVNADWNASSGVAQILNKPTIPDISGKADAASVAPAFSDSSTYAVGDYVTYHGLLYKCTTAVSTAGAWDAANWTAVAVTDEMGADTPLPFDAECEYVASPADGGCGISPPYYCYISGSCDCTIELYIPAGSNSSDCFSIGAWKSSNCCCIFANSGTATQFRYDSSNVVNGTYATDTWQTLGFVGTTVYCGSSTGSFTRSIFSDTTTVFGVGFGKNIRIRRIRLTYKGTDIFDARSVRVGQIGAMYDVVRGKIFYSSNTNNLVPGPDKAQPTITTPGRIVELTESPAFTGTPTAPTAASGTNTTQIATTAFVQTEARYALTAKTPSVSGTSATVACEDRAINDFTVATGITSLTITPPAAVTGRARDFFCRVTLTDSSLPTVTLSGATIDIGSTDVAGMTQGVNLLMFTEISSGHWLASRRSAS